MNKEYNELKRKVYEANLRLPNEELVKLTWGNVSEISKDRNYFAIKPSGVKYSELKVEDIVLIDMKTGKSFDSKCNPSTDTPTHWFLYKKFEDLNSICHTHSKWATIFAQNKKDIKMYGTSHADSFCENIFCTREMTDEEVKNNYEYNTGKVIYEKFNEKKIDILKNPAILVSQHGAFSFGIDSNNSVNNSVILEVVAEMAYYNELLNSELLNKSLMKKHNDRKHGSKAYYGQKNER